MPPCSAYHTGADCIPADSGSTRWARCTSRPTARSSSASATAVTATRLSLRAQDLDQPNGKILRIKTDGTAPSDNPFYDGTNDWRSRVWLYGVRNPFGFSLQPTSRGDLLRRRRLEHLGGGRPRSAGGNFGWPCYEGATPQPYFQATTRSARSLRPAGHAAVLHLRPQRRLRGDRRPVLHGHAVSAAVPGQLLLRRLLGQLHQARGVGRQHHPVSVQPFATDVAAPVAITAGPDGMLYYLSFTSGEVRRIRFNGPVADATATPALGYSPLRSPSRATARSTPAAVARPTCGTSATGRLDAGEPDPYLHRSTVRPSRPKLTVTTRRPARRARVATVTVGSVRRRRRSPRRPTGPASTRARRSRTRARPPTAEDGSMPASR